MTSRIILYVFLMLPLSINIAYASDLDLLDGAMRSGDLNEVKRIVALGTIDLNKKDSLDSIPVVTAALVGKLEIVKFLISKGSKVNNEHGAFALNAVCFEGGLEIAKVLLKNGADINGRSFRTRTPLMNASQGGSWQKWEGEKYGEYVDLVKFLLSNGANVNAIDLKTGWTALMIAAGKGHNNIVNVLISNGAKINLKSEKDKNTDPTIVQREHVGSAYTAEWTALMWAAQNNHIDVVKTLLKHGADKNIKNYDSKIAADYVYTKDKKLLSLLR